MLASLIYEFLGLYGISYLSFLSLKVFPWEQSIEFRATTRDGEAVVLNGGAVSRVDIGQGTLAAYHMLYTERAGGVQRIQGLFSKDSRTFFKGYQDRWKRTI